jgi:hypothetical protein
VSAARGWLGLAMARQGKCAEAVGMIDEAINMYRSRKRADPYGGLLERTRSACT